jgi:hypothetical protein
MVQEGKQRLFLGRRPPVYQDYTIPAYVLAQVASTTPEPDFDCVTTPFVVTPEGVSGVPTLGDNWVWHRAGSMTRLGEVQSSPTEYWGPLVGLDRLRDLAWTHALSVTIPNLIDDAEPQVCSW